MHHAIDIDIVVVVVAFVVGLTRVCCCRCHCRCRCHCHCRCCCRCCRCRCVVVVALSLLSVSLSWLLAFPCRCRCRCRWHVAGTVVVVVCSRKRRASLSTWPVLFAPVYPPAALHEAVPGQEPAAFYRTAHLRSRADGSLVCLRLWRTRAELQVCVIWCSSGVAYTYSSVDSPHQSRARINYILPSTRLLHQTKYYL